MYNQTSAIRPIAFHQLGAVSGGNSTSSTLSNYGNACVTGAGAGGLLGGMVGGPAGVAVGGLVGCGLGMLLQAIP